MKNKITMLLATPGAVVCQMFYAALLYILIVTVAIGYHDVSTIIINTIIVVFLAIGNWGQVRSILSRDELNLKTGFPVERRLRLSDKFIIGIYLSCIVFIPAIYPFSNVKNPKLVFVFETAILVPLIVLVMAYIITFKNKRTYNL